MPYIEQISLFPQEKTELMSLEEMRLHEWVIAWSGGKDSTATIIKAHELGIQIKCIVFVLMMWKKGFPAILPEMYQFVMKAKGVFESWGIKVNIIESGVYAYDNTRRIFAKSTKPELVGKEYGARAFLGGGVPFKRKKKLQSVA